MVDHAEGGLDEEETDDDGAEDRMPIGIDLVRASLALECGMAPDSVL